MSFGTSFGMKPGIGPPSASSEDSGKEREVQAVLANPALRLIPSLQQRKIDTIMQPEVGNSPGGVATPTAAVFSPSRYSLPNLKMVLVDPQEKVDEGQAASSGRGSTSRSFKSMIVDTGSSRSSAGSFSPMDVDIPASTVRDSASMEVDPTPFRGGGGGGGGGSRSSRSMSVDIPKRKQVQIDEVPRRVGGLREAVLDLEKRMGSKAEAEMERREAERTRLLESRENARIARLDAAENARLAALASREEASEALRRARENAVRVSSGALIEGNRQRPQFVKRAVYRPKKGGDTQAPKLPRRVVPKKKKCKVVKGVRKCKAVKKKK